MRIEMYIQVKIYTWHALNLIRTLGAQTLLPYALDTLGNVLLQMGNLPQAEQHSAEGQALAEAQGGRDTATYCALGLGRVALACGVPGAVEELCAAADAFGQLGLLGIQATALVIKTRRPLLFATGAEQEAAGAMTFPDAEGGTGETESYLGVPIAIGERVIGVVSVQSYRQYACNEGSVRLLATLAGSMGVAIENTRVFEAERRRTTELTLITNVQFGGVRPLQLPFAMAPITSSDPLCLTPHAASLSSWSSQAGASSPWIANTCSGS